MVKIMKNNKGQNTTVKISLICWVILFILAVIALIYNFSIQKEIAYFSSMVAVCGTLAFLVREIYGIKKNKHDD